jgi:hypothetical protein
MPANSKNPPGEAISNPLFTIIALRPNRSQPLPIRLHSFRLVKNGYLVFGDFI